jgi:protein disulfide-isomerase
LPPEVSTSLIPGWTEDFEKAKARAKEEGKFVLAYFLNSRPSAKGADNAPRCLDAAILGSREFLDEIDKDFVPFMQEMHRGCWSWTAHAQFGNVVEYAMRPKQGGKAKRSAGSSFSPPEVAIIAPDGKRVCLLEKGGWEGGAVGYLAKVKREFESAKAAYEEAMKVHEKAKKLVPPKTDSTSTPPGFIDDLDAAFAMAKAKGKLVFACFTGSDWCHWCKKLDNEILSKPEFYAGVKEDFVLVFIDMPNDKNLLSEHAKKANGGLVKKYGIKGFPMALIFDGDGKRLGEIGYEVGGPAPYVKSLMKFRNKGE